MADKSKMKCNVPRREVQGGKKFVVKACQGGTEKIVRFGDSSMKIKKDKPDRKKSYCARSGGIKGKSNKLSANYWSRKAWDCYTRKTASVGKGSCGERTGCGCNNPYTHNFYKRANESGSRLRHSGLWEVPATLLPFGVGNAALGAYRANDPVNKRQGYSSGWRGAGRGLLGTLLGSAALGIPAGMLGSMADPNTAAALAFIGGTLGGGIGSSFATDTLDPVERLRHQEWLSEFNAANAQADAERAAQDDELLNKLKSTEKQASGNPWVHNFYKQATEEELNSSMDWKTLLAISAITGGAGALGGAALGAGGNMLQSVFGKRPQTADEYLVREGEQKERINSTAGRMALMGALFPGASLLAGKVLSKSAKYTEFDNPVVIDKGVQANKTIRSAEVDQQGVLYLHSDDLGTPEEAQVVGLQEILTLRPEIVDILNSMETGTD